MFNSFFFPKGIMYSIKLAIVYHNFDMLYRYEYYDHMNWHTAMPSHECQTCNKYFANNASLKKHKKRCISATQPLLKHYKCDMCSTEFNCKDYLSKHLESFHQGQVYCCEHCGEMLKWKTGLVRHIKSKHAKHL